MSDLANELSGFEMILFRRSLGVLAADRCPCSDCGRTPLEGETVHVYPASRSPLPARGERIVCELCRQSRRKAPSATAIVRHATHGQAVRLTARAA